MPFRNRPRSISPRDRDVLIGLMTSRQAACEHELQRLDERASVLRARLRAIDDAKLAEELACFREVLALHRRWRQERVR